jgi:hypothetical protein
LKSREKTGVCDRATHETTHGRHPRLQSIIARWDDLPEATKITITRLVDKATSPA